MHFEAGDANEETRAGKLFLLVVFAKNMTNVLAEKAFDALAKLLDAIDIQLRGFPFHSPAGLEGRDFVVDTVVPRNVGDKVFNAREGFHWKDGDGLVLGEIIHARLAGKARAAVDFCGTRAALPCFAIPTNGKIGGEVSLKVVERVENNHAGGDGDAVVHSLPTIRIAAENAQDGVAHDGPPFCEHRMASSQRSGRAQPETFHLVKLAEPMCEVMAFMAFPWGSLTTKSRKDCSFTQAESVQKLRLSGFARSEYPMIPGVKLNCF